MQMVPENFRPCSYLIPVICKLQSVFFCNVYEVLKVALWWNIYPKVDFLGVSQNSMKE